jgi:histidyl-tRNA synthetase
MPLIQPRTLKGFRDYLPEAMIPREQLIATAQRVYHSFGFSPIDTPALEYLEVLTGKGSVPKLGTPFKRYHIATVWRGENTQRGRYREFMQCDFDTIGTKSVSADIETGLVIHDLLRAIGFSKFSIRINNRMVLNGLLDKLGLASKSTEVLRSLDKLGKIGRDKVAQEMLATSGATAAQADEVLKLSDLAGSNAEILAQLAPLVAGSETGEEGVDRLNEVLAGIAAAGVDEALVQVDVSIARGLDYYTGVIFETFLDDLPTIGSVCSGGRYDNLAELFTKQELPGIGASLGLDRLLAAMEELEMLAKVHTPAPVFIPYFDRQRLGDYLGLAGRIRAAGIGVEVFPEPKKLGQQLKYANSRGFSVAVIAGTNEFAAQSAQLKNLQSGESEEVSLIARILSILSAS